MLRTARAFLVAVLIVQTLGCGTILYPERRGQTSGRYDTDVVLLDAAGLLLFIIPGVIAFAVDIFTGAIYLPPGEKSKVQERLGQLDKIQVDPTRRDPEAIARMIARETGIEIDRIRIYEDATGCNDAEACLARYASGVAFTRAVRRPGSARPAG